MTKGEAVVLRSLMNRELFTDGQRMKWLQELIKLLVDVMDSSEFVGVAHLAASDLRLLGSESRAYQIHVAHLRGMIDGYTIGVFEREDA